MYNKWEREKFIHSLRKRDKTLSQLVNTQTPAPTQPHSHHRRKERNTHAVRDGGAWRWDNKEKWDRKEEEKADSHREGKQWEIKIEKPRTRLKATITGKCSKTLLQTLTEEEPAWERMWDSGGRGTEGVGDLETQPGRDTSSRRSRSRDRGPGGETGEDRGRRVQTRRSPSRGRGGGR